MLQRFGFQDLEKILAESAELRRIVEASAISRDAQKNAMVSVLEKAGADDLMVKFIGALCLQIQKLTQEMSVLLLH